MHQSLLVSPTTLQLHSTSQKPLAAWRLASKITIGEKGVQCTTVEDGDAQHRMTCVPWPEKKSVRSAGNIGDWNLRTFPTANSQPMSEQLLAMFEYRRLNRLRQLRWKSAVASALAQTRYKTSAHIAPRRNRLHSP